MKIINDLVIIEVAKGQTHKIAGTVLRNYDAIGHASGTELPSGYEYEVIGTLTQAANSTVIRDAALDAAKQEPRLMTRLLIDVGIITLDQPETYEDTIDLLFIKRTKIK